MLNHQSVPIKGLFNILPDIIKCGFVPLILGQPGIGKTEVMYQILKAMGYDYIYKINPNTMEITDLHGTPGHSKDESTGIPVTVWYAPVHWLKIIQAHNDGKKVALIIDEVFQADDNQAKFLSKLILERQAGDLQLPKELAIVAGGNREEDNSLSSTELGAMVWDRFKPFELEPCAESWLEWALENDVHPDIVSGIRTKPTWITQGFNPEAYKSSTPRGQVHFSDYLKQVGGFPKGESQLAIVESFVGKTVALEMISFQRVKDDLPNIQEIYSDPDNAPLPKKDRADVIFTLATQLGYFADKDNLSATVKYCERLDKDFAIIALGDVWKKDKKLAWNNKEYQRFILNNRNVRIFSDILDANK